MRTWTELTQREKATLAWGKIRRFLLVHFRPGYVRRSIARRRGDCQRTGACCNLLFTCPVFTADPLPTCRVNRVKPKVCRMFPIDERDLRDRDLISPHAPCGFTFVPRAAGDGETLPKSPE